MGRGSQRVLGTLGHCFERDPAQNGQNGLCGGLGPERLEVDGTLRQPSAQRNSGQSLIYSLKFWGGFTVRKKDEGVGDT